MKRGVMALVLAALVAHGAAAQRGDVATPGCAAPNLLASWYTAQQAWWKLDQAKDWSADTLRVMLLAAAKPLDTARGPFPIQLGVMIQGVKQPALAASDSARVEAARDVLRTMAKTRTWPIRSLVGPAGVRAAWLIARGDSALGMAAMHRMMEAGPGEASAADVAVLEDWSRQLRGRKPIYASLLEPQRLPKGQVSFAPVPSEDLAHVDLRRDAAGLPPLSYALCMARSGKVTQ